MAMTPTRPEAAPGFDQAHQLAAASPIAGIYALFTDAIGVVGNDIIILLIGDVLNAPREGGIKRVINVRDDDRNRKGFSSSEAADSAVGLIAKLFNRVENTLVGFRRNHDRSFAVQHIRHHCLGNIC
jgi:hypothetical protein